MRPRLLLFMLLLGLAAAAQSARAEEILPGSPRAALADFADLYLDGTVVDRERWLADMREVEVLGSELSRFHIFRLSDTSYLATYEARARGRAGATIVETHIGVTSAWVRRGGSWQNLFYEENALEPVRRSAAAGAEASH